MLRAAPTNTTDFQDAGCLLISEVHLFLSRPGELGGAEDGSTAVTRKTKEYVDEFSRYKEQSTIREVRAVLIKHAAQGDVDEGLPEDEKGLQLSQFEMAQLANLSISDVDEARTLIPTYVRVSACLSANGSLASKDDAQLESLLHELSAIRRFP